MEILSDKISLGISFRDKFGLWWRKVAPKRNVFLHKHFADPIIKE